ncbi:MAG: B12-binding domain-containing radical SAM protein [Candidatus Odinarchaeia archaeon]
MKVALIVPPLNFRVDLNQFYQEYTCDGSLPPLGLMYIGSVLKENNIDVKLLDLSGKLKTVEWYEKWLKKEEPDLVGISIIADAINTAMFIAKVTKKVLPNTLVVGGGITATFLYEKILTYCPYFDLIVRGEGEYTLLKIINALSKGKFDKEKKHIAGISYRGKDGKVKNTPEAPLITDLDSLPFPDRSLSDIAYSYQFGPVRLGTKKFTSILTSRGCPFNCTYCACSAFTRRTYRARSYENVLDEFEELYSQGYKQALITDDHFFMSPKRTLKILRGIRKRKIDMDLICESRVDFARLPVLKEAVKSGVKAIFYGIESGSQKMLNYYNKKITPLQSIKAIEKSKYAGIDITVGSFMYGGPYETLEDLNQTHKFIMKLNLDVIILNIVDVLPGTPMWREAESLNILPEYAWQRTVHAASIFPNTVPLEKVKLMIDKTYRDFIKRKEWIAQQIIKTLKSRWRLELIYTNLKSQGIRNMKDITEELISSDRMYRYQYYNPVVYSDD